MLAVAALPFFSARHAQVTKIGGNGHMSQPIAHDLDVNQIHELEITPLFTPVLIKNCAQKVLVLAAPEPPMFPEVQIKLPTS